MMRVLLESRAKKQRRSGGAVLSIVAHVAIIGAAVVGTVSAKSAPREKQEPQIVRFDPPPATQPVERQVSAAVSRSPVAAPSIVIRHVDVPTTIPTTLPPIDMSAGLATDSVVLGGGATAGAPGPRSVIDGEGNGSSREWNSNEVLMNVLTPARPRYPESLRSAGVDGRVLVQFVVDTTGRVDMSSVKILSTTHELFSKAVRDALGNFRFRPAQAGGRRVSALAQMPFDFQITR